MYENSTEMIKTDKSHFKDLSPQSFNIKSFSHGLL